MASTTTTPTFVPIPDLTTLHLSPNGDNRAPDTSRLSPIPGPSFPAHLRALAAGESSGSPSESSGTDSVGPSSTLVTPGVSRVGTPSLASPPASTPKTALSTVTSISSETGVSVGESRDASTITLNGSAPTITAPLASSGAHPIAPSTPVAPVKMPGLPSVTPATVVTAATPTGSTVLPPSAPPLASRPSTTSTAPKDPTARKMSSVFGKLFDRNNSSNASLHGAPGKAEGGSASASPSGATTPTLGHGPEGAGMERGNSSHSNAVGGKGDVHVSAPGSKETRGESLSRRPSRKEERESEKERERARSRSASIAAAPTGTTVGAGGAIAGKKEAASGNVSDSGRPRAESNGYVSSGEKSGKSEREGGMGAALSEFMRNKVTRKTSVTSKKSDDGKSDKGSLQSGVKGGKKAGGGEEDESAYGGSTVGGGDAKSKSGQTTASLLKKYGVCEKVAIGKGATAVVKLAHKWDRTTERLYAVKEFRKRRKNETEKEYVKKLTSEFCISSTLHHHNIVETVDLVQDEQSHWCEVMEYCPGGDLYAAIKKGNMSAPEINSYFKQIISGVTYLHSMGVAHRDIKPENLLLDAKGHIKITDFGVSDVFRMCWEKTTHLSKGLCGSEPYIAPEQFEQKEYDARLVDVWACAIVFYCMHFQELPWRVAKSSDPSFAPYRQMFATSASPAPLSNLVPRECRSIIKKMLDPDPKTRATTEDVVKDPWFTAIVVIPPLGPVATTAIVA